MPIITGTPNQSQLNATIVGVATPTIQNATIVVADTEQSIVLPASTERFRLQVRGNAVVKLSYTSGQSGITYITIWPGSFYFEDNLDIASLTLYLQASKTSEVIEIISWV